MFLATASFTSETASPTSAMVHGLSAPIAPTAVMKGSDAFVGSSLACKATARIFAICPSCALPRLFDDETEHVFVAVNELARVAELGHERRNRLARGIIVGDDFEHLTGIHLLEHEARVDGRSRADLPAEIEAASESAACHASPRADGRHVDALHAVASRRRLLRRA